MVIVYGYQTRFKREGNVAPARCNNCGHDAAQSLCRQTFRITLFGIPIISIPRKRGVMCESCGNIIPLTKSEYKERRKAAKYS